MRAVLLFFDGVFESNGDRVRAGASYPPPNRFMMAPVSILGGGAEERMGAGELNTSAGEGKVETMLRLQTHTLAHICTLFPPRFITMHSALSTEAAVHAGHAGMGKEVKVV